MAWDYEDDKRVGAALMNLLGLVTGAFIHHKLKEALGMEVEDSRQEPQTSDWDLMAQKLTCQNGIGTLDELEEETLPDNVIQFPG
jgi:hypothetical protein